MYFSDNLRYLRKLMRLDQAYLAEALQVQPGAISAYETGRNDPKIAGLVKLAEIFDISIDSLLLKDLSKEDGEETTTTTRKASQMELAYLRRENADLRELVETQRALIEVLTKNQKK